AAAAMVGRMYFRMADSWSGHIGLHGYADSSGAAFVKPMRSAMRSHSIRNSAKLERFRSIPAATRREIDQARGCLIGGGSGSPPPPRVWRWSDDLARTQIRDRLSAIAERIEHLIGVGAEFRRH